MFMNTFSDRVIVEAVSCWSVNTETWVFSSMGLEVDTKELGEIFF
jgi:hypothetical protein